MRRALTFAPLVLLTAACGESSGAFTQLTLDAQASLPSTANAHGWTVTATRAEITLGPVRFYEGEPLFARASEEALRWLLGIREAHAHPGHYEAGAALAEWLDSRTVDLLADAPTALGVASGVTGEYRSARLDVTGLTLEGTAHKGEARVPFSVTVDETFEVEGIAFGAQVQATPGVVHVLTRVDTWVDRMDLADHPGGPLTPGTQPHTALLRGLTNTSAYAFELEP